MSMSWVVGNKIVIVSPVVYQPDDPPPLTPDQPAPKSASRHMDPGDDIIDVLYRYREDPHSAHPASSPAKKATPTRVRRTLLHQQTHRPPTLHRYESLEEESGKQG